MNGEVMRPEFDRLQEDADWNRGRVLAHEGRLTDHEVKLTTIVNKLSQIEIDLRELAEWKDDSKIHEIAALKGRLRKNDKLRDRVIYALLMGGALEGIRLFVERWFAHH